MEHWPLFEDRYVAEVQMGAPAYQDSLLVTILLLLLVGASLWTVARSDKMKHSAVFRIVHSVANVLITLAVSGLIFGLVANRGESEVDFWLTSGRGAIYSAIFFIVMTLIYLWIWFTFAGSELRKEWFVRYFQLWGWVGVVLYFPLTIALVAKTPEIVLLIVVVLIYLVFKTLLLILSIETFKHVLRYPLHIIMYLCTCELLPLIFVYNGITS